MNLHHLYHKHRVTCNKYGCLVSSVGVPFGSIFVLDPEGNYYRMGCDKNFRNYNEEFDNEERFD